MVRTSWELLYWLCMKILMILGTGSMLSFPMDKSINPDCFSQGHSIMEKISTYHDTGNRDQGWYLNDSNVQVAGFYCQWVWTGLQVYLVPTWYLLTLAYPIVCRRLVDSLWAVIEHSYQESNNFGDSTGGKHPLLLTNEHTHIIKIYFIGLLTAIILWDISQRYMQTIYERGITHDGH